MSSMPMPLPISTPIPMPTPHYSEDLLAKELSQLSLKDRNDYQDEIHCVTCLAIDETQILIEESMHELQLEIDNKIPDTGKTAYLQSQLTVKGRTFVNARQFRLRFLRYELFNIQKSAIRMLKWLDKAYDLFGAVVLERPIRLSADFTVEEQKVFRKGYVQLMPVRAFGTGRRVVCCLPYDEGWYTISKHVILKILMYTSWVIGNDIDTQRKGAVLISMFEPSFPQKPTHEAPLRPSDHWLMTVRTSAMHICTPDTPFFRLRRNFFTMAIGSNNPHPGNEMLRNLIDSKVEQLYEMENSKPSKKKELVLEIMDEMQHTHSGRFLYWHQCSHMSDCWWVVLHTNGDTNNDQKIVFNKIEPIFRKQYYKKQQQQKLIRTRYMNEQQELILHQNNMVTDAQKNNSINCGDGNSDTTMATHHDSSNDSDAPSSSFVLL
ncbi:hypothetical protein FRACYDRAFT_243697 [Fragilariopsis cylindrus CCMP1102]|uniref:Uncharacterized protein n=1 Tax=Fragilariopsis cylindrus CCMP1102 TaxID=635003 RepID=A0A1E7F363_9STRA|nr:hypothetical protein FRACYDRAFT_243697 [Fragilariopsis cylindrus CCMP1102]|eukprot:OEU12445.1 hypothetical protein FRACYDRAFT_243697 [Fragilariopsis cylindrus CCMP1102]